MRYVLIHVKSSKTLVCVMQIGCRNVLNSNEIMLYKVTLFSIKRPALHPQKADLITCINVFRVKLVEEGY